MLPSSRMSERTQFLERVWWRRQQPRVPLSQLAPRTCAHLLFERGAVLGICPSCRPFYILGIHPNSSRRPGQRSVGLRRWSAADRWDCISLSCRRSREPWLQQLRPPCSRWLRSPTFSWRSRAADGRNRIRRARVQGGTQLTASAVWADRHEERYRQVEMTDIDTDMSAARAARKARDERGDRGAAAHRRPRRLGTTRPAGRGSQGDRSSIPPLTPNAFDSVLIRGRLVRLVNGTGQTGQRRRHGAPQAASPATILSTARDSRGEGLPMLSSW